MIRPFLVLPTYSGSAILPKKLCYLLFSLVSRDLKSLISKAFMHFLGENRRLWGWHNALNVDYFPRP